MPEGPVSVGWAGAIRKPERHGPLCCYEAREPGVKRLAGKISQQKPNIVGFL